MKKWLSFFLALCLLVPVLALSEAAPDEATLVEITLTPGELPAGMEQMQSVYTDLMNALGLSILAQDSYGKFDLLLSGESVLSFETLMKEGSVYALSQLFGDKAIVFSAEDLSKAASSVTETVNLGPITPEMITPVLTDMIMVLQGYLAKGELQEGEFAITETVTAAKATTWRLNADDMADILAQLGQSIAKQEALKAALEASVTGGQSFEDMWAEATKNVPEDFILNLSIAMDANDEPVYVYMESQANSDIIAAEIAIDSPNQQIVLQVQENTDNLFVMVLGLADETGTIDLGFFTPDANGQWQPDLTLGFALTVQEAADQTNATLAMSVNDKHLFTLNVKEQKVSAAALPSVEGAVNVLAMSEEEQGAFLQSVIENATKLLEGSVEKLPASLQSLLSGLMQ